MKQPNLKKVLLASSLTLAFASALVTPAHAELVSEDVQADAITPEASGMQSEVVILKKAAVQPAPRQVALPAQAIATPVAVQAAPAASATATATATATSAARPTVGTSLDQGMANKMDDVRNQFENALLRTLDRIKITVDDGAPAAASATATATATAAAPVVAPAPAAPATTIVNDSIVNATASPANYMTVESAPLVKDEATSVADAEDHEDDSFVSRIRVAPVIGVSSLGSNNYYNISSSFTAGVNVEMEVAENFAAYLGYTYAKYDVSLGNTYGGGIGWGNGYGYNPLQYNQNVFDLGGRFYLMPAASKFRVFVGGGVGLSKGYINYRNQNPYGSYGYGYGNLLTDYEVNQWLGSLETGAEFKVARNVAIGANFKYSTVLSSRENDRLRNYGFYGAYGAGNLTQEQLAAGSSIANESFYSILGTVKVSF